MVTPHAYANKYTVNVKRSSTGDQPEYSKHTLGTKNFVYDTSTFWKTNGGIRCFLQGGTDKANKPLIECNGPTRYRVQFDLNCSLHKSEKTAFYFFISNDKDKMEFSNFYFWCT